MRPGTLEELRDVILSHDAVRVRGGGTKSPAGEPVVDATAMAGIVDYSPDECVITARAGTPLVEIDAALAAYGQYLPFDPPFGTEGATIGGTVAAGVSGPRRYRYGGVRDFLIGVQIVDGEARVIRSGGKVVKNAAGFLLHHGVVGSCGRFGVLTETTVKVFPAPEARRTVVAHCGSVEAAHSAALAVEALRADCEAIDFDDRGVLTVTVAGRATAIDARRDRMAAALRARGVPAIGGQSPTAGTVPPERGVPENRGQSPEPGTVPPHMVKVAGAAGRWQNLHTAVATAQFMCAGAVAWLSTDDLPSLARALRDANLAGQVIRGPYAGARIGRVIPNEFEERVRRVLDPRGCFSAAPHPEY